MFAFRRRNFSDLAIFFNNRLSEKYPAIIPFTKGIVGEPVAMLQTSGCSIFVYQRVPIRGGGNSNILTLESAWDEEPSGLFLKLFEYTLGNETFWIHLGETFESTPKHPCYTFAAIQNEVIEVLKEVILEKAVFDINTVDIGFHPPNAGGTRDPTNTENISIVIQTSNLNSTSDFSEPVSGSGSHCLKEQIGAMLFWQKSRNKPDCVWLYFKWSQTPQ